RQDLQPGLLTRADLTSLLPFNDSLLRLSLSGGALLAYLPGPSDGLMGMAGLRRLNGAYVLEKTGRAIDPKKIYKVLVNNYMQETSPLLKKADPNPVEAAKDWRDPIEQWLLKHPSSPSHPLEKLVDFEPRL